MLGTKKESDIILSNLARRVGYKAMAAATVEILMYLTLVGYMPEDNNIEMFLLIGLASFITSIILERYCEE